MNIKELLSKKSILFGHEIPYKTMGIISGMVAYALIVQAATSIQEFPIYSIFSILYAFGVLLPVSYYQMKMSDSEATKENAKNHNRDT